MAVDVRSVTIKVMRLPALVHWQRHVLSLLVSPVWWQWYEQSNTLSPTLWPQLLVCDINYPWWRHHSNVTVGVQQLQRSDHGLYRNVTFVHNIFHGQGCFWNDGSKNFFDPAVKLLSHLDYQMQSHFLTVLRYANWHWCANFFLCDDTLNYGVTLEHLMYLPCEKTLRISFLK